MRAVTFDQALTFDPAHPDPAPQDGEALLRVHSAGICATDLQITRGYMNFRGVLGHEMVGTVTRGPAEWRGKRVVCEINCVCRKCDMCQRGLSGHCRQRTVMGIVGRNGCFADFVAMPVRNLHALPDAVSDEEAVFVEPLAAAFQVLAQVPIERRMAVCVVGSGRLGNLVAQVLQTTGCKLIVVGRNERKLELCEKRGIQTLHLRDAVPKHDQDIVVDCSGSPDGVRLALQLVRPRGTVVLKTTAAEGGTLNLASAVVNEVNILGSRCGPFPEAINALARRAVDVRPLISRTFPIERAIEALDAARQPENVKVLLKVSGR